MISIIINGIKKNMNQNNTVFLCFFLQLPQKPAADTR